jgi:hypothetical protein
MKKLSREQLKNVVGGNPPENGCGQYQGQTTYTCGTRINEGVCYIDICFCNGTPVPGGCNVRSEDMSDCQ